MFAFAHLNLRITKKHQRINPCKSVQSVDKKIRENPCNPWTKKNNPWTKIRANPCNLWTKKTIRGQKSVKIREIRGQKNNPWTNIRVNKKFIINLK